MGLTGKRYRFYEKLSPGYTGYLSSIGTLPHVIYICFTESQGAGYPERKFQGI